MATRLHFDEKLKLDNYLPEYRQQQGSTLRYELYGIIFHIGENAWSGHYNIAVKGPDEQWTEVDDDHAKQYPSRASEDSRMAVKPPTYLRIGESPSRRKPIISRELRQSGNQLEKRNISAPKTRRVRLQLFLNHESRLCPLALV